MARTALTNPPVYTKDVCLSYWMGYVAAINAMTLELMGTRTQSFGAAAPTTGTHAVGDICWNTAPTAGEAPGWICVSASGSGTWKAMANLAA